MNFKALIFGSAKMRFVAIMDPTHQWPVFDAAAALLDPPAAAQVQS
jgi:hypothetical protein